MLGCGKFLIEVNDKWLEIMPQNTIDHLPSVRYDHTPFKWKQLLEGITLPNTLDFYTSRLMIALWKLRKFVGVELLKEILCGDSVRR